MTPARLPDLDLQTLTDLPPEWPENPVPSIREALRKSNEKVVVLDDDPTGTQTVHGVPVLTEWDVERLREELANDLPAFYLLTNTRSLTLGAARVLNTEIGRNLRAAAGEAGRSFVVVSRSDSTLRGHYPGEIEALAEALETQFDATLIIPFFLEGGRYTLGDVHYVAEGGRLVPAGETEFARDASFGYHSSNLRDWVEEKTGGRVTEAEVASISIEDIRTGGPGRVAQLLGQLSNGAVCVVNAASNRDLEAFTLGLLAAEAQGKKFLYRTAASFVPVRAGIEPRPLLSPDDLDLAGSNGGLVVIGSYVPRSTGQASNLFEVPGIIKLEVPVDSLLDDDTQAAVVTRLAGEADRHVGMGETVVVYTSRRLVIGEDADTSLEIGRRVSQSLVDIVRAIPTRPRYFLAKGGITSSDLATKGLDVKRAMVLGQIFPGVPVWQLGAESRHPGLPYIVFPGNVGGPNALADIVTGLAQEVRT